MLQWLPPDESSDHESTMPNAVAARTKVRTLNTAQNAIAYSLRDRPPTSAETTVYSQYSPREICSLPEGTVVEAVEELRTAGGLECLRIVDPVWQGWVVSKSSSASWERILPGAITEVPRGHEGLKACESPEGSRTSPGSSSTGSYPSDASTEEATSPSGTPSCTRPCTAKETEDPGGTASGVRGEGGCPSTQGALGDDGAAVQRVLAASNEFEVVAIVGWLPY